MNKKMLKNIEWGILICCLVLLCIGIVALFSATQDDNYEEFQKQILWALISIPIMIIIILVDYNLIAKISPVLYGLALIALVAVLFTEPISGARSWFKISESTTIQPSEFAKLIYIFFLAYIIVQFQKNDKTEINKIWKLGVILLAAGVPIILIVIQPDYGTAMAFVVAVAFMLFAAGIDKKYIIAVILIAVIAIPVLYIFVLPNHAKSRIDVFLNPELDPRGSGYNLIQSKLAIGSGKLLGMGILMGNQTQLRIPLSKSNRLYILSHRRRDGIYSCSTCNSYICNNDYKSGVCSKNCKRRYTDGYIAIGIARNINIPYVRKYRYDNGIITYNWCTTSICKLWGKFTYNKLPMHRNIVKY